MESNQRFTDGDLTNAGGLRLGISIDEHIAPESFLSCSPSHTRARAPRVRAQSHTKNRERVEYLTLRCPETLRFRRDRVRRTSPGVAREAVAAAVSAAPHSCPK